MNDLDLRTALHRDAELVGAPSPDLLDQLVQRRQRQRHQRLGVVAAVLGVVVIAAGIPVGQALLARSGIAPAGETVIDDPTPSVIPEVVRTTPVPTPTTAIAPVPEPGPQAPGPASDPVSCPDHDTLQAALPADTPELWFRIFRGEEAVCSGTWVAAGYSRITPDTPDGEAGLWRYVDGSWTFRYRTDCAEPEILPASVWERACNVD